MTPEQYYYICETAVKNNGLELQYVNTHKIMDFNLYNKICTFAVNNNSNALRHIVDNIISPYQYYEICKLAIKKDKTALKYVDKVELPDIEYDKINNYESLVKLAK
jgi:hypothetical protein